MSLLVDKVFVSNPWAACFFDGLHFKFDQTFFFVVPDCTFKCFFLWWRYRPSEVKSSVKHIGSPLLWHVSFFYSDNIMPRVSLEILVIRFGFLLDEGCLFQARAGDYNKVDYSK